MSKSNSPPNTQSELSYSGKRFYTGSLSVSKKYHLYTDCHHIKNREAKEAKENAIQFHDLSVCEDCEDRYISLITVKRRQAKQESKSGVRLNLTPEEKDQLDQLVYSNIVKDRSTAIRMGLYEFHQTLGTTGIPDQWQPEYHTEQTEVIYSDIMKEDMIIAGKLVDSGLFTTQNEVYRTAVILYINALSEVLSKTDYPGRPKGLWNKDGIKPAGVITALNPEQSTEITE